MANRDYGNLDNAGAMHYAPNALVRDGGVTLNPTAAQYLAAGYYPVEDTSPTPPDGQHAASSRWVLTDGVITRVWEYEADTAPVVRYSKLKFLTAAKAAGKWAALKALLEATDNWDAFVLCQYMQSDDALLAAARAAVDA